MNIFKLFSQDKMITLNTGDTYRFHKGTILIATEMSAFIIPGEVFIEGVPIKDILKISNDNCQIQSVSEEKNNGYSDIVIILKKGDSISLTRNCELIHIHLKEESIEPKKFIIK